jgi:hypothetical protein
MSKNFSTTLPALLTLSAAGALFLACPAHSQTTFDPAKVSRGMQIAPVPLNIAATCGRKVPRTACRRLRWCTSHV